MVTLLIIGWVAFAVVLVRLLMPNTIKYNDPANAFDSKQDYIPRVNGFIRREVLFEIHKWISAGKSEVDVNTGLTGFLFEIQDLDTLQQKTAAITAVIVVKMSKDIKNAFYREYAKTVNLINPIYIANKNKPTNKNKRQEIIEPSDGLYIYVSRMVYFFIRRIVVDTTTRLATESESPEKITRNYMLQIEKEIYNINDIDVVEKIEPSASDDKN